MSLLENRGGQNSSEQSCDSLLFHSLVFRKSGVLRTVNGAAWRTGSKCEDLKSSPVRMDHSPINQYFELNKSRQKFHHSLKEHHKISNIPKFLCKMLWNADNIALRSLQFSAIIDYKREMVTTSVRNTKWLLKITNFARLYYPHFTTFCNETLEYY
jgi:hypothetical protein